MCINILPSRSPNSSFRYPNGQTERHPRTSKQRSPLALDWRNIVFHSRGLAPFRQLPKGEGSEILRPFFDRLPMDGLMRTLLKIVPLVATAVIVAECGSNTGNIRI